VSNKIIQSDNAVIDYTVISALIDTVNQQQQNINDLLAIVNHTAVTFDPVTGNATQTPGIQLIDGGVIQAIQASSFKAVTVKFNKNFTNYPTTVVGVVQSTQGAAYCYLSKTNTATEAQFTIVANSSVKQCNLYWYAFGN